MDAQEFREFGYAAVDFVADYLENVRERLVEKVINRQFKDEKRNRKIESFKAIIVFIY